MLSDAVSHCFAERQCTVCHNPECRGVKLRTDDKIIVISFGNTHPGTLLRISLDLHAFCRLLAGFWQAFGRLLAGFWQAFGRLLAGFWQAFKCPLWPDFLCLFGRLFNANFGAFACWFVLIGFLASILAGF